MDPPAASGRGDRTGGRAGSHLIGKGFHWLETRPHGVVLSVALALMLLLGLVDWRTGIELSFALFYLLPVSLSAWAAGRGAGLVVSIASALTWQTANLLAGEHLSSSLFHVWNAASRLGFFVVVTLLLTEVRHRLEYERALSGTDFLTGVRTSRAFYEAAAGEIARARRSRRPLTAAFVDVDDFKAVNDTVGHVGGDEVLRAIAGCLKDSVRSTDVVGRLGGDEFALLLPETDQRGAEPMLLRVRDTLSRLMRTQPCRVTLSIGAVVFLEPPDSVDQLLSETDKGMYAVKSRGKDAFALRTWP